MMKWNEVGFCVCDESKLKEKRTAFFCEYSPEIQIDCRVRNDKKRENVNERARRSLWVPSTPYPCHIINSRLYSATEFAFHRHLHKTHYSTALCHSTVQHKVFGVCRKHSGNGFVKAAERVSQHQREKRFELSNTHSPHSCPHRVFITSDDKHFLSPSLSEFSCFCPFKKIKKRWEMWMESTLLTLLNGADSCFSALFFWWLFNAATDAARCFES